MLIHPQEGLLQEARALQQSAAYDEYRARRVAVEHRLARLVQLGLRQSRYFGRVKTRFQLYLAATVANLTLVAGKSDLSDSVGGGSEAHRAVRSAPSVVRSDLQAVSHGVVANATAIFGAVRRNTVDRDSAQGFTAEIPLPNQGFSLSPMLRPFSARSASDCCGP